MRALTNTFKDPPCMPGFKVPPLQSVPFTLNILLCYLLLILHSKMSPVSDSSAPWSQTHSAARSSCGFPTNLLPSKQLKLYSLTLVRSARALRGFLHLLEMLAIRCVSVATRSHSPLFTTISH